MKVEYVVMEVTKTDIIRVLCIWEKEGYEFMTPDKQEWIGIHDAYIWLLEGEKVWFVKGDIDFLYDMKEIEWELNNEPKHYIERGIGGEIFEY